MYNFEALNEQDRKEMLNSIKANSIEEIFSSIPKEAKMTGFGLDEGHDEIEAQKEIKKLANLNKTNYLNFLGQGSRKRYIPSCIKDVASRFEFLSCYTPYQAEISQGTL